MTALTIPTARRFASWAPRLESGAVVSKSPFTGQRQVYRYANDPWSATIVLNPMPPAEYEEWNALFLELDGPSGKFLMGDPVRRHPRGLAASSPGTPLVKGAGQTGASLLIDGAGANKVGYLLKGDYFQHGTDENARLYKLIADASTNGSGETTLHFRPRLRVSPNDNAAIVVDDAVGVWSLVETFAEWKIGKGGKSEPRTVAVEEPL